MTQRQIYDMLYLVTKHDNSHLGDDKSSRVANSYAVKATWHVYNNPKAIIQFSSILLSQLKDFK